MENKALIRRDQSREKVKAQCIEKCLRIFKQKESREEKRGEGEGRMRGEDRERNRKGAEFMAAAHG